jgi:hypothetical protein
VQTYRTTEVKTRGGPSSLLFHSDGTLEAAGPSKSDQPSYLTGRWRSDPGDPTRVTVEIGDRTIEYRIIHVSEDELRLEESVRSPRSSSPH